MVVWKVVLSLAFVITVGAVLDAGSRWTLYASRRQNCRACRYSSFADKISDGIYVVNVEAAVVKNGKDEESRGW
jgi:hypothetical protein